MGKDIRDLIGGIISNTDNSYSTSTDTSGSSMPTLTFDKGAFREKLSLGILRDIIMQMTDNQIDDVDGMIDKSIMDHIKKNYNGSCYGYLCKCRDKCGVDGCCSSSPMLGDIIQEINEAAEEAAEKVNLTKDPETVTAELDPVELAQRCDNYAAFRDAIRQKVSDKIVKSVAAEIVGSNEAPTFKKTLDKELAATNNDETKGQAAPEGQVELTEPEQTEEIPASVEEKPVGESVIISAMQNIISESYYENKPIGMEAALNQAIVEYCISEMDMCFKQFDQASQFYNKYQN